MTRKDLEILQLRMTGGINGIKRQGILAVTDLKKMQSSHHTLKIYTSFCFAMSSNASLANGMVTERRVAKDKLCAVSTNC